MFIKTFPLALLGCIVQAYSNADPIYQQIKKVMEKRGYTYEVFERISQTGFQIPLYRVTGKIDGGEVKSQKGKTVLIQHGAYQSGQNWADSTDWHLRLYDEGYDVWFGNNSDVDESVHIGESYEDDWKNLNWANYGLKDLPVEIDTVLEISGAEDLTYIGYSQGTSQMLYALNVAEDQFINKVARFIALAPCAYADDLGYESIAEVQSLYDSLFNKAGVLFTNGSIEERLQTRDSICRVFGETSSECQRSKFEYNNPDLFAKHSNASKMLYSLTTQFDSLIEPIGVDDFLSNNFEVKYISHGNIKQVPTTFFMFAGDEICPVDKNMRVFDEIITEKHLYIQPFYDHYLPGFFRGDTFLSRIVAAIETGDPKRASEFQTSQYSRKENLFWDTLDFGQELTI